MIRVQLTKAIPGYLEGEVLTVDENSAKSLVDRKVAKEYDPDAKNAKAVVAHQDAPGVVHIQQVVDADTTAPPADESEAEPEPEPEPPADTTTPGASS